MQTQIAAIVLAEPFIIELPVDSKLVELAAKPSIYANAPKINIIINTANIPNKRNAPSSDMYNITHKKS